MIKKVQASPTHKRLIILRHAKAEKAAWGQIDFERPLASRGEEDTAKLSTYLKQNPIHPDRVLCSPSLRTSQTYGILSKTVPTLPTPTLLDNLYLASAGDLLQLINEQEETSSTLMIIGHNPGLAHIILQLVRHADPKTLETLQHSFPTCGFVILDFPDITQWNDITPDSATLTTYIHAKTLPNQ
jgi:phosphohistidine phosphatase